MNVLEKIETSIWGTWGSNPGPNGPWTAQQPLHHMPVFVIITSNENNILKTNAYAGKRKTRVI